MNCRSLTAVGQQEKGQQVLKKVVVATSGRDEGVESIGLDKASR